MLTLLSLGLRADAVASFLIKGKRDTIVGNVRAIHALFEKHVVWRDADRDGKATTAASAASAASAKEAKEAKTV